jgi:hypothetical protein
VFENPHSSKLKALAATDANRFFVFPDPGSVILITMPAKLAILARTVVPELFARAMSLVNRMLPAATGPDGNRTEDGMGVIEGPDANLRACPTHEMSRW